MQSTGGYRVSLGCALVRVFACGVVAMGCGGETNMDLEPKAATKHEINWIKNTLKAHMWARVNGRYSIPMCFTSGYSNKPSAVPRTPAAWANDKSIAFQAVVERWGTYAPIDFTNQGDCGSSSPSDWIPVTLVYDSTDPLAWGGVTNPGRGQHWSASQCTNGCINCNTTCQVWLTYGSQLSSTRNDLAHEVGHALGLDDSDQRADFPRTGTCPDGSTWDTGVNGSETNYLTAVPDFASIMSNRNASCFKEAGQDYGLSDGDKLAISMLYPWSLFSTTGSIGSTRGIYVANGVVIRNDGSFTINWYARGAHSSWFFDDNTGAAPSWTRYSPAYPSNPVSLGSALERSASSLPSNGPNAVSFTFRDDMGRTMRGRDTVIRDSAVHTAILASAASAI
jgi:hypothetical protein